jgi:hypothetical protein
VQGAAGSINSFAISITDIKYHVNSVSFDFQYKKSRMKNSIVPQNYSGVLYSIDNKQKLLAKILNSS